MGRQDRQVRRVRLVRRGLGAGLFLLGLALFLFAERLGLRSHLGQNVGMGLGFVASVLGLLIWNGDAVRRDARLKGPERPAEREE